GFGALAAGRPVYDALGSLTRQEELPNTPAKDVAPPAAPDVEMEMKAASGVELREIRARENDDLESWGWVDQAHGVAHVPIERAMAHIVAHALPARALEPVPTATAAGSKIPLGESNGFSEGGAP